MSNPDPLKGYKGHARARLEAWGVRVWSDVRAVNDQGSERSALSRFRIERQTGGLTVRLYKSGKPVSMRKYGIGDTLVAVAEAAGGSGDSSRAGSVPLDSCRFVLKHDRRVVTGATIPATLDEGREMKVLQSRFEYPIGDSAGVARLGGGEYSLEVVGFGAGSTLRAGGSETSDDL